MTWAICGKTAEEDAQSYAKIRGATVQHEIAVHTYGHIDASICSPRELRADVERCLEVLGLKSAPKTFIFPWNREGNYDTIREMGFTTYRAKKRAIAPPRKQHLLWNIAPVYYLDQKSLDAFSLLRRYLDFCISTRTVFHLWLHPWSIVIGDDPDRIVKKTLEPLFHYVNKRRTSRELAVCTMGTLAEHFEAAG
jgi:peptidoglycan/xylan/chitin deacetylase (PgdA/CDA1 family)